MSINLWSGDLEKIQLITDAVCAVDVMVFHHDRAVGKANMPVANEPFPQSIIFPGGSTFRAITTAVTTDICSFNSMYGDMVSREVESIHITNIHATDPVGVTPVVYSNGAAYRMGCGKVTLQAGESLQWTEHTGWVLPVQSTFDYFKVLTADEALLNQNTVQQVFPTNGILTVPANTTFLMEARYIFSTGATTRTTGLSFPAAASFTSLDYLALTYATAALTIGPLSTAGVGNTMRVTVNTNIVVNATTTAVETNILLRGIMRINAGGTLTPSFTWSADPTGACKILKNSFFRLTQMAPDKTLDHMGGVWA